MFKRLMYLLTAPAAIDVMIADEKDRLAEEERENDAHRLYLCFKHRQEPSYSSHGEVNCSYCQAKAKITDLSISNGLLKSKITYFRKKAAEWSNISVVPFSAPNEELKEANAKITLLNSKVKALQYTIDSYRRGELDPG